MSTILNILSNKKEQIVLFLMLEMLHFAIWFDFASPISRSLMLSHLGLFLIWQPVWHGDEKLSIDNIALFIIFTFALTAWLNLWLLFAWLVLLIGFISGRVTLNRNERVIYILALGFLVIELLFACVPYLAKIDIEYNYLFKILMPLIPLIIIALPVSKTGQTFQQVDFIHAITASMLTSLVAMGSLLTMYLSESTYFVALAYTLIAIGGFILCISWLLITQSRFSSVSQLWSNYMLNIGTPFEEWLAELSILSEKGLSPDEFLNEAMQKLVNFSWISGVKWSVNSHINETGDINKNEILIKNDNMTVCIFTFSPASTSLNIHCNLLIKLLNNFYINKEREQELTKQTHLKAIYETGARITHDIKNLLQSLQAITSIVQHDTDNTNFQVSQQVLKKQLPGLTQRLQLALDKLQTPKPESTDEVYLKDWWNDLQKRNAHNDYTYQNDVHGDPVIPVDLFDSVVDNLLENIQVKQINEPDISVTVTLVSDKNITSVTVCDTGSMIPESISRYLLSNAITSDSGLGIGLYQANKHAQMFGYTLNLVNNQEGRVCFELSSTLNNDN